MQKVIIQRLFVSFLLHSFQQLFTSWPPNTTLEPENETEGYASKSTKKNYFHVADIHSGKQASVDDLQVQVTIWLDRELTENTAFSACYGENSFFGVLQAENDVLCLHNSDPGFIACRYF